MKNIQKQRKTNVDIFTVKNILHEIDEIESGIFSECSKHCDQYNPSIDVCTGYCADYVKQQAKYIVKKYLSCEIK